MALCKPLEAGSLARRDRAGGDRAPCVAVLVPLASLAARLAKWSLLCAAFFFWRQGREMKRWDRWKADYCRALDRLKLPEA
jgi:hypothetical protein